MIGACFPMLPLHDDAAYGTKKGQRLMAGSNPVNQAWNRMLVHAKTAPHRMSTSHRALMLCAHVVTSRLRLTGDLLHGL